MFYIKITVPTRITLPRKTKKDKRITISLSQYRNIHYVVNNQMKAKFSEIVAEQLKGTMAFDKVFTVIHYEPPSRRKMDLDNCCSVLHKFLGDCLVEHGLIEDDNLDFINKALFISKNQHRKKVYEADVYICEDRDRPEDIIKIIEEINNE